MDGKAILNSIIALVLYIVFAIIYFLILSVIIYFGAGLIGVGDVSADALAIAAAVLTAGTIIAGGGLTDAFKTV